MDSKQEVALIDYGTAFLKGAANGALDCFLHPVDTLLMPIGLPLFDAGVVASQTYIETSMDPDIMYLRQFGGMDSKREYYKSLNRLKELKSSLADFPEQFASMSGVQKSELMGNLFSTILVPGAAIKGLKAIAKPALPLSKPVTSVRVAKKYNLTGRHVSTLSISQIREMKNADLMYVVDWDNKLIIAKQEYDHFTLGAGKPCRNAGDVGIADGKLDWINNKSGSYRIKPSKRLAEGTEKVFREFGFTEAPGKFRNWEGATPIMLDVDAIWIAPILAASARGQDAMREMKRNPTEVSKHMSDMYAAYRKHEMKTRDAHNQSKQGKINEIDAALTSDAKQRIKIYQDQATARVHDYKSKMDSAIRLETELEFARARAIHQASRNGIACGYVDNFALASVRQQMLDAYQDQQIADANRFADNIWAEVKQTAEAKKAQVEKQHNETNTKYNRHCKQFMDNFSKLCLDVRNGGATKTDVDAFFDKYKRELNAIFQNDGVLG